MREGNEPERYDPAAAEDLGRSTYDKVRAAWNIQNAAECCIPNALAVAAQLPCP